MADVYWFIIWSWRCLKAVYCEISTHKLKHPYVVLCWLEYLNFPSSCMNSRWTKKLLKHGTGTTSARCVHGCVRSMCMWKCTLRINLRNTQTTGHCKTASEITFFTPLYDIIIVHIKQTLHANSAFIHVDKAYWREHCNGFIAIFGNIWDIFHHMYGYTFVHLHTFFNASRECIQFKPI